MKKRIFVSLLSLILASLLAFLGPMQALAENKKQYVEDVIVVAANTLKDAQRLAHGYTVLGTPIYDGGDTTNGRVNKSWLCYKTTTDASKAVTDLRAMRMNDPWDYQAYNNYLKQLKTDVEVEVDALAAAVYEFQNNLGEGKPKSEYVYNVLQYLCDDEANKYEDEDNPGKYLPYKRLGDLFYDLDFEDEDSNAKNDLAGILLKSNAQCINIIYNALTLACSETNEKSFLDVISLSTFNPSIYKNKTEYNSAAQDIIDTLYITQEELKKYEERGLKYEAEYEFLKMKKIFTPPETGKGAYEQTLNGLEYIMNVDSTSLHTMHALDVYNQRMTGKSLYYNDELSKEEQRIAAEVILVRAAWYMLDGGLEDLGKVIKKQDTKNPNGDRISEEMSRVLDQILEIAGKLQMHGFIDEYNATIDRNQERYKKGEIEIPEVLKNLTDMYENDYACYKQHLRDVAETKTGKRLYNILKGCNYRGYNGEYTTLYDLVMAHDMTVEEEERDGNYEPSDFYPIIAQLSDGQRAMLKSGILNLVLSVKVEAKEYTDSFETLKKIIKYVANGEYGAPSATENDPFYSVYAGVDPDIFKEDSGIAMTSSAVKRTYTYEANIKYLSNIFNMVMGAAGATAAIAGTTMLIAMAVADHASGVLNAAFSHPEGLEAATSVMNSGGFAGEYTEATAAANLRVSISQTVAKVFGGIMAVAMIVLAVVGLVEATIKIWAATDDSDYLEIPRIACTEAEITTYTVNLDGGLTFYDTTDYVYYYGVTNPNIGLKTSDGVSIDSATDPSHNDLSKYKIADVANWSLTGNREWIALYYTKTPGIGQPILADSLTIDDTAWVTGKNTVCRFDGTDTCDMQQFLSGNKTSKYVHYAVDKDYDPFTTIKELAGLPTGAASVFAEPSVYAFSGMTLLLGAAAGCGITVMVNRKKKKDA